MVEVNRLSSSGSTDVPPLELDLPSIAEKDYAALRRLGKRPVLKVANVQQRVEND